MDLVESRRSGGRRATRAADDARRRRARLVAHEVGLDAWRRPRWGDHVAAEVLDALGDEVVVLRGLAVPGTEVGIDHLVVAPTGVFVIVTCDAPGPLGVGTGTVWDGRRPMHAELTTVQWITDSVADRLGVEVVGVMCCTRAPLPEVNHVIGPLQVVNPQVLSTLIMGGPSKHPEDEVDWIASVAEALLRTTSAAPADPTVDEPTSEGSEPGDTAEPPVVLEDPRPVVLDDPPPVVIDEPASDDVADGEVDVPAAPGAPEPFPPVRRRGSGQVIRIPAADVLGERPRGATIPRRVHARQFLSEGSRAARLIAVIVLLAVLVAAVISVVSSLH